MRRTPILALALIALFILPPSPAAAQIKKWLKKAESAVRKTEQKVSDALQKMKPANAQKIAASSADARSTLSLPTLELPSANDNFLPITLHTHRGRPRFGYVDRKDRLDPANYRHYVLSRAAKQFAYTIPKMDRSAYASTRMPRQTNAERLQNRQERARSNRDSIRKAQFERAVFQQILQRATSYLSEKGRRTYFCPPRQDCDPPSGFSWGGRGADQFTELDARRAYWTDNAENYGKWAEGLPSEAYAVWEISLGAYDFDRAAFPFKYKGQSGQLFHRAVHPYEEAVQYTSISTTLYHKMSETDARKLLSGNERPRYYLLASIVVEGIANAEEKFKTYNDGVLDKIALHYHLNSPIMEIYRDAALKEKLYEINLDDQ